jgi:sulfane dehydrogenase subunit SoxC
MVERPLVLSMDDIVRLPSVSRIHFLECSGNTLTEWKAPKEKTVQGTHGLLSCAEWTGVPLSVIADQVGLRTGVKWMLAEGADAAVMDRSIPLAKVLDDALLVYSQNGERLRPEQGYPLRLLLPGYEGNMSIKWLRRLKFSDAPFHTREETSKYSDLMPDGKARQFTFDMEAKSVITSPSGGMRMGAPGFREVRGLAWSGRGRISRVDVSADGGRTWQQARLQSPVLPKCLTRFSLMWNWQGGPAILQSRCIDETGYVQPTLAELVAVRGVNSVYHLNAIQSWGVAQNGEVSNVHA